MESQNVGATAFDLANDQHPNYENKSFRTDIKVPEAKNREAMKVDHAKVMRAVNEGK